jgi:hypothetical protein
MPPADASGSGLPAKRHFPHRRARVLYGAALLVAVLLRVIPQHVYQPNVELQDVYPMRAAQAVASGSWEPPTALSGGSGLFGLLRVVDAAWFEGARALGVWHDRVDMMESLARDRVPFVLVARGVVILVSLATVLLVGVLAHRLYGWREEIAAVALLGVTFVHVRETHHVWHDVLATFGIVATAAVGVRVLARASLGNVVLLGAVAGLALAACHRNIPVALTVASAVVLASPVGFRTVAYRLGAVGVAAIAGFAVASPYLVTHLPAMLAEAQPGMWLQTGVRAGFEVPALLGLMIGWPMTLLAVVGVVAEMRAAPRRGVVLVVFPIAFLLLIHLIAFRMARYLAAVAPFVALFAARGATWIADQGPREWRGWLATAAVVVAGVGPLATSVAYDVLRTRTDTRVLAGRWLMAEVPDGATISVPNIIPYPNPVLPMTVADARRARLPFLPALRGRGAFAPLVVRPMGMFTTRNATWQPQPGEWVVTSSHPIVQPDAHTDARQLAALRAANAVPVATFEGIGDPSPAVVFDPLCIDYLPLAGFRELVRPGPNLTIWHVPPAASR